MNLGIEDETLEFKRSTGELNEALVSICAMLNKTGNGTIYFGVHPNGEIKGQDVTDSTLRDVSRKIYEAISPQISPKIKMLNFDDKSIIEVTFSGLDKPYSCRGIYYIRSADEDRVLPPNELRQLFEYNKNLSWDKELTDYTFEDIDLDSFNKFYNRAISSNRLKTDDKDPKIILNKLGLMVNEKLTNAAYYLFSNKNPIVLKMAVFATDQKQTFLDINRVKGNIIDLIDRASEYVKERIYWGAKIIGMKRVEEPEIPMKALREIICNSFVHARYNSITEHEISIFPSKVVIYNPGAFPIGYNPEDFVKENLQSIIRNPLILDTLYLSDDVESYGSGLKNVYTECELKNVKINYVKHIDGFSFELYRHVVFHRGLNNILSNEELSLDEDIVFKCLIDNSKLTAKELAIKINKSSRTVQRILDSLIKKDRIKRIGGTRGYWEIL